MEIEVGALVRCAAKPEWGLGQVQSVIGGRVTVMFEGAGKQVFLLDIDAEDQPLELVQPPRLGDG